MHLKNRIRFLITAWYLSIVLGATYRSAFAAEPEYEVKTAFLYNFAKFVEWPREILPSDDTPLIFCIVAPELVKRATTALQHRRIKRRQITVITPENLSSTASCHVLYVADERQVGLYENAPLEARGVLTVTDSSSDGIISFTVVDGRVKFRINASRAAKAGLRISSQLMKLSL